MNPLRNLSARALVIVDQGGFMVADPAGNVLGVSVLPPPVRLVYALATNTQSGLDNRYLPSKPPNEISIFGLDFSDVIPLGVGIASGVLDIFLNVAIDPLPPADTDFNKGAVQVTGRALRATLGVGKPETDYILRWTATDTQGNVWPRSALLLVGITS